MSKEDRLFIRDGRRSYRRRYSRTEPRIGLVILVGLAAVVAWVAWKGAHPDPELFKSADDLLPGAVPPADRGPLPADLAAEGWREGPVSRYDASNLYEKINGREDYYKSFGFRTLYWLAITHEEDPGRVVDIELYDLGETPNALGAYAGERAEGTAPEIGESGMAHFDRNAFFMTRGGYYLRAIGSEESATVRAELEHLKARFDGALPGEPLPAAYAIFVGGLGLAPGDVAYAAENAFSFGFAREVYSARLEDDETEVFFTTAVGEEGPEALAERFREGFLEYGRSAGESGGIRWVEDRYLGTLAGAEPSGDRVIGVRSAPDRQAAELAIARLRRALAGSPS